MRKLSIKQRLTKIFRLNKKTLLAFAVPSLILLFAYMTRGIYPVANRSLLTIDLFHQYAPFLADLQNKLRSGGSLLYSWSGGLGVNFLSLIAYYLASPLNLLIVFFPASFLTEAVLFLIVIKIGLAGAFMYVYLRGVWEEENYQMVALASLYALSSFSLAYSWNIMWLDSLYILPLLMLGLVRLVRDQRCLLYTVSLAYALVVNYYMAFFIVLFTVLYFPVCLFTFRNPGKFSQLLATVGRFAVFSLIGSGLSAFLLLPTFISLRLTSAAGDSFPASVTHYSDLFDYISQHFMLMPPTIRSGLPNMYSGILVLILVPVYFFSRSIPVGQKLLHLVLILVLIVSFNVNVLNFIWHGLHFPNQLPFRNSFVYIFLMLSMSYPALRSIKELSGRQIGAICAALMLIVILAQKLNAQPLPLQALYVTLIFLAIYAAVLTIDRVRPLRFADWSLMIICVVVAELLINTLLTVHTIDSTERYSNRQDYAAGLEPAHIRREIAALADEHDRTDFYRLESFPPKTTNDGFLYGYRGLSIFASTMPTSPVKMFQNLGYHSNGINSYKYEGSNIVLDSLFGLRYLIRRTSPSIDDLMRTLWLSTDQIEIYQNPYALPLGYMGRPELIEWNGLGTDPFTIQNRLLTALADAEPVFHRLPLQQGEHSNLTLTTSGGYIYSFTRTSQNQSSMARIQVENDQDQQLYLYLKVTPNQPERGYIMIDERRIDFNARRSTLVDLGWVPTEAQIELYLSFADSAPGSGRFEFYAVSLDEAVFVETIEHLREQALELDVFRDTRLKGTITAKEDGVMMLTIPYDQGWKLRLNGQPAEFEALADGFLCVPLSAGTHRIEMRYRPPWFMTGLLISLGSLLLLIILYQIPGGLGRRKKRSRPAPVLILPEQTRDQVSEQEDHESEPADQAPEKTDNG